MVVALIGLLVSLLAYLLAFPHPRQRRFEIYLALLALHILATIAFWLFTFEGGMDAFLYYRDPYNYMEESPFKSGTEFIVHVVQTIKGTLGGSFLDHFLLFQCFGMIGIALLIRSFNEVAESFGMTVPLHVYLILFLPGLHFWSVAIGKDAPMIMAICLAGWSALRIQRRYVWTAVALVIMLLIRPHVGAITIFALASAVVFTKQLGMRAKLVLAPLALAGLAFLGAQALARFQLDLDAASFASFFEQQQELGEDFGQGADTQSLSFPMKVFTLLFRPFYYDGSGFMHLAASIENTVVLYFFAYLAFHWRMLATLIRRVSYIHFSALFTVVLTVMLSLVNYNVGLGLRQKMMVMPTVMLMYGTVHMYKRFLARRALAVHSPAPPPGQAAAAEA